MELHATGNLLSTLAFYRYQLSTPAYREMARMAEMKISVSRQTLINSLQSDGYNVYMYLDNELHDIEHLCCMAHVRANFKYAYEQGKDERVRYFLEIIAWLYEQERKYKEQGLSVDEANDLLNKQSGMLGLTGFSDMRDVEAAYLKGEERAVTGLQTYVYTIVKFIGSYIAALGGVDAIVFTAGIGEKSIDTRRDIINELGVLGIYLDEDANNVRSEERLISTKDSKVACWIIPTDEELMIAKDTFSLI